MSDWASVTLASVAASLETGKRPKGGAVDAGVPSLGGEHVYGDGSVNCDVATFIPEEFFRSLTKGRLADGDILIVKDGATTGKTGRLHFPSPHFVAAANEHVFVLRMDQTRCLQEYAYHLLRSPFGNQMVMSDFRGAAQGGISRGFAERVIVPLPPLDEQRRIVRVLDRAAEVRRRTGVARAKARAIIPALFLDMFGDPATNPRGWNVTIVGNVLADASYGTSKKASDGGEGLPVIRMGNVTSDGQLNTTDLKYANLSEPERKKAELLVGDLLFNRTNSKELVGKTGLWDGRFEAVAASYFIRLRANSELIAPTYLWAYFNTPHMKRALFDTARGAIGQANINLKELRAYHLILPPLALQTAFAEQVTQIESTWCALNTAMSKAEAMFSGLASEVFG